MSSADFNTMSTSRALDYIMLHLEEGYLVTAYKENHLYKIHVCLCGEKEKSDDGYYSLLIEVEVLKKKMDNAEAFLEDLIHYIFVVCKDDDYITSEAICRKLYKYNFIDKKDGEWIVDTPQTEREDE